MSTLSMSFRKAYPGVLAVALWSLAPGARADDKIYFRNQSRQPVRVVILSDEGRFRGKEFVRPGESERLPNGKGKTLLSVNGRTFRVRDIGYQGNGDSWTVNWRGGSGGNWGDRDRYDGDRRDSRLQGLPPLPHFIQDRRR